MSSDQGRDGFLDELALVLTPEVLHHLPDPLHLSDQPDALHVWVADRVAESLVMAIRARTDHHTGNHTESRLLGLLILAEFPATDTTPTSVHIGYLFAQTAWGQGFATELLGGLVTWYQAAGKPVQLFGGVETGNPASANVLRKNGFERVDHLSNQTTKMFRRLI